MNSSTIFVLITVMVTHESLGQDDEPACPNRQALAFTSILMSQLPQNWYVNRLTIMTQLPPSAPDPPAVNCCSPLTYLADCKGKNPIGGIHVFREWQADGGFIKITKAYSDKFKDIAEFWESQMIYDTDVNPKLIYGGFLRFMYLHEKDKKKRVIKTFNFPPLILFAAVSWVEISEAVVKENRVGAIEKEIDQYLKSNPYIPAMDYIPTELPFQV